MKFKIICLLAFVAIFFPTCTSDVYNPDICFQENILPIFVSKCSMNGCHNSSDHEGGFDLTTYEGIMEGIKPNHPLQSEIYNEIKGNNPSMPVGQKLDPIDVTYIKIWIKIGAKNTSNCSSCDTSNYSYSGRVKPLMTNWCIGCHNNSNAGGGVNLSSYNGVSASIAGNKLIGSLDHLGGFSAMPKNTNKLSDCDINAVKKWVNGGFPNN